MKLSPFDYRAYVETLCRAFASQPSEVHVDEISEGKYEVNCAPCDQGKLIGKAGANSKVVREIADFMRARDGKRPIWLTVRTNGERIAAEKTFWDTEWNDAKELQLCVGANSVLEPLDLGEMKGGNFPNDGESSIWFSLTCPISAELRLALGTVIKRMGKARGRKCHLVIREPSDSAL